MGNWTWNISFWPKVSALLFLLTALKASRGLAQQPLGNLHLSQSKDRVLTTLKVAGSDPVPVVFDTGTSGNILDRKLAAKFGLPNLGPSTAIDGSLGKPIAGFLTEVKGAILGNLSIDDGQANAVDYDLPDEKGVFGPNCFPGKLVHMDLGIGSILVMPKTAATLPPGAGIPYIGKGDDALPSVIVDFGSLQIAAELDTGNNAALLLPLSFTNQLSLEDTPKKVGEAGSVAGQQPLFRARRKGALKIGPLTLDRPIIMFIQGGQPNVGLPIARELVVVFDPSARRSWLISARSAPKLSLKVMLLAFGAITACIFIRRKLRKNSGGTLPPP
jgi:hypothetical protein